MKKVFLLLALGCAAQFATIEPAKAPDQDIKKGWEEKGNKEREEKHRQENLSEIHIGEEPVSIVFLRNGDFVAIFEKEGSGVMAFFRVNHAKGILTPIAHHRFAFNCELTLSPNGKHAAIITKKFNGIKIYAMNDIGKFSPAPNSIIETTNHPRSVTYSPNGKIAGIMYDIANRLDIYDVNLETGALTFAKRFDAGINKDLEEVVFSSSGKFVALCINNSVSIYSINPETKTFTKILNFPVIQNCAVAFSPNEKLAAVANLGSNTVSIYAANTDTGDFTEVAGSPFKTGERPVSIAFSPQGNFAAITNKASHNVSVYAVNLHTGVFAEVAGSPFKTAMNPELVTFSPDGNIALVYSLSSGNITIYEVNQETGALTPITGNILEIERKRLEDKEAREALVAPGLLPGSAGDIISQYLGAQPAGEERKEKTEAEIARDIKEETEHTHILEEIAHAKKLQEKTGFNTANLFVAITHNNPKLFHENLTPFSINTLKDYGSKITPLMEAAKMGRREMVEQFLKYGEPIRRTREHVDIVRVNLSARDSNGNTALMIAIDNKNFAIAHMIAQKMNRNDLAVKNTNDKDAYDLAMKYQYEEKNNVHYQGLIKILAPVRQEQEARKEMEEVD